MEEKILAMLKTKATAFGFSETELSEAAKTIASFINNAEATDEEITSKVDLMLPVLGLSQKAANRVIEKAKKSAEEEAKKQQKKAEEAGAGAGKNEPPKTDEGKKNEQTEMPDWFKVYKEENNKKTNALIEKLTAMTAEKTSTNRKQKLEELVKDSGMFGTRALKAFERMSFKDDEDFDSFFNETKTDLDAWKQERTDAGLGSMKPMGRSNNAPTNKLSEGEVDQIAGNF